MGVFEAQYLESRFESEWRNTEYGVVELPYSFYYYVRKDTKQTNKKTNVLSSTSYVDEPSGNPKHSRWSFIIDRQSMVVP